MSGRRGVLLVMVLLAAFGGTVLLAALRLRSPAAPAMSRLVLTFETPNELPEGEVPFRPLLAWAPGRRSHITVWDVVRGLHRAAADDGVESLVLHIGDLGWGWARIAEVRDAVLEFRGAGKPVYAVLPEGAGEAEYYLASAADVICLQPTGMLRLDGLAISALFLHGTFDKLGVSPNFVHVGRYKSAVEAYTRGELSPPAREQLEVYLDDSWRGLIDSLAVARRLPRDSVERLIENGPYTARQALAAGLVDSLIYETDADSLALRRGKRRFTALGFGRYLDRQTEPGGERVGLVTVEGALVPGKSRETPTGGLEAGSESIIDALRDARRRSAVKAIVLRIDSPGGSSQASDDIWHEVERCRRVKPVIVSMSDYAASGGYYIAAPADSIVAQPGTLTGSIGVYGGKFNLLGLYRKLGLNVETVSRGRHAGMFSAFRDFTPEETERYQGLLEDFYRGFVQRVARGRGLTETEVDSVGQGRVWSGESARARGLVDRLGGLPTALAMARARAHIPEDASITVERFPRVRRTFLQQLFEDWIDEDSSAPPLRAATLPPVIQAWLAAAAFPPGELLAMLPYSVEMR